MGSSLDFGDLMHDVEAKEAGKVSFSRSQMIQIVWVIIFKFEYEIGNVDYDDFLLELKSIYSMLKG